MGGVGLAILIYLAIGAVVAWRCYAAVDYGLEHKGHNSELDDAMRQLERAIGAVPGGMVLALIAVTVLWLWLALIFGKSLTARKRDDDTVGD